MLDLRHILILGTVGLVLGTVSAAGNTRQSEGYFDDYLLRVLPRQFAQRDTPVLTDGQPTDRVNDLDILGYFKEVPREHWSCCMLGKLAGDKGFHCAATFYATRIAKRNVNRAHSRRMMFHGPRAIPNWGRDIMTTFTRCISNHEEEFHRCCHVATVEVKERRRWQAFRQHTEV